MLDLALKTEEFQELWIKKIAHRLFAENYRFLNKDTIRVKQHKGNK